MTSLVKLVIISVASKVKVVSSTVGVLLEELPPQAVKSVADIANAKSDFLYIV